MIPTWLAVLIAGVVLVWTAVLVATRRNRSRRMRPSPPSFDELTWREVAATVDVGNEYRGYDS